MDRLNMAVEALEFHNGLNKYLLAWGSTYIWDVSSIVHSINFILSELANENPYL